MESLRREWSGDVDLGDGELEQLHQTYMQLISFIQGIGLEKRKPLQVVIQAPVVQTLDSAIHRINHYYYIYIYIYIYIYFLIPL